MWVQWVKLIPVKLDQKANQQLQATKRVKEVNRLVANRSRQSDTYARSACSACRACRAAHKGMQQKLLSSATSDVTTLMQTMLTRNADNICQQKTMTKVTPAAVAPATTARSSNSNGGCNSNCCSCLKLFAFAGSRTRCYVSHINTYLPRIATPTRTARQSPRSQSLLKVAYSCCQYNSLYFLLFDVKRHLENSKLIDMEMPRHTETYIYLRLCVCWIDFQ